MGHFFGDKLSMFKWAFALLWGGGGGGKILVSMVWGTYAVKIEVQMGFCFIKGDVKACQDALGHLVITIKTVI